MLVSEVLTKSQELLEQEITVEGTFVTDNFDERNWYLTNGELLDFTKAIALDRSIVDSDVDVSQTKSDLTKGLAKRGMIKMNPLASSRYENRGPISILGKLVKADKQANAYLLTAISKIIWGSPYDKCNTYLQRDVTFNDVILTPQESITIPELVTNLDKYLHKIVRLEGYLQGDREPEVSVIVPYNAGNKWYGEVEEKVEVRQSGIIGNGNIVSIRLGGRLLYFEQAQVIGTIVKSTHPTFIAALENVNHLLIKKDDGYCIQVWNF